MLNRKWKKRIKSLVANRPFQSKDEVIAEGVRRGYNKEVTEKVIDFIMDYLPNIDGFSVKFEDNVLLDYDIDSEDLADIYTTTLSDMNVKIPKKKEQDQFMMGKGQEDYTLALVIEFIEWCKKMSNNN